MDFFFKELFEYKQKYDESENTVVRATRVVADKFYNVFGSMFKSSEMSEVLTEITKMDPTFDSNEFIKFVQNVVIPNVLESISRQDLDVLRDWCTDTAFTILSHPINSCKVNHVNYHATVLDISNVDVSIRFLFSRGNFCKVVRFFSFFKDCCWKNDGSRTSAYNNIQCATSYLCY